MLFVSGKQSHLHESRQFSVHSQCLMQLGRDRNRAKALMCASVTGRRTRYTVLKRKLHWPCITLRRIRGKSRRFWETCKSWFRALLGLMRASMKNLQALTCLQRLCRDLMKAGCSARSGHCMTFYYNQHLVICPNCCRMCHSCCCTTQLLSCESIKGHISHLEC